MYLNHTPPPLSLSKHARIRAAAGSACFGRPVALVCGIAQLFGSAAA